MTTTTTVEQKTKLEEFIEIVGEEPFTLISGDTLGSNSFEPITKVWLGEVALRLINGNGTIKDINILNEEPFFTKHFELPGGRWPKTLTARIETIELKTIHNLFSGFVVRLKVLNILNHNGSEVLFKPRGNESPIVLKGRYWFTHPDGRSGEGKFEIIDDEELKEQRRYPF